MESVGPNDDAVLAEDDGPEGLDGRVGVLDAVDLGQVWRSEDCAFGGHGFFGEDGGAEGEGRRGDGGEVRGGVDVGCGGGDALVLAVVVCQLERPRAERFSKAGRRPFWWCGDMDIPFDPVHAIPGLDIRDARAKD